MGGLCVLLLMMFCVGWILCVFFLSMLIPLLILYNGIVGIVCFILYFVLRKKSVFTKYAADSVTVRIRLSSWQPDFQRP